MGRAIVREPAVFLMDEPLSNLDAKLRVQTRAEIARLHQRLKVTTVYVTHDQVEAMTMGQRIAVMSEAVLQQVGTPQALYDHPVNRFVAGFIGSPAMNFMPAKVQGDAVQLPMGEVRVAGEARDRLGGQGGDRPVIAGIRPESFEDASLVAPDVRERGAIFRTTIDLVESMGAEQYAYFQVQAQEIESEELRELAEDAGTAEVSSSGEGQVVARIDAASEITRGTAAELWLDSSKLHFFDPSTGHNLAAAS
jgi:multiple sugar transport system ATP-binding protein